MPNPVLSVRGNTDVNAYQVGSHKKQTGKEAASDTGTQDLSHILAVPCGSLRVQEVSHQSGPVRNSCNPNETLND